MPALHSSSLRFLLRFPGKLKYDWEKRRNFEWPFDADNIDYCLEEHQSSYLEYRDSKPLAPVKKYSLLIFTRSALPYRRTVHNHSFTMKLKQEASTSSIKWTCDHIDNSEQLRDTLSKFQKTKKLEVTKFTGTETQNVCFTNERSRVEINLSE
jgi:hypothetical protein